MPVTRLRDMFGRGERGNAGSAEGPRVINGGDRRPLEPWAPPAEGVREVRHYSVRPGQKDSKDTKDRDVLSGGLLWGAGLIIAASLVGAGYVAYEAQRLFALEHLSGSDPQTRASIIAALPDAGWGAMAVVALVAALRGRSSMRARLGVVVFFGLSLGAQLMYAEDTIEGYLVAVIAPVTLAWMLESFIVEVRRWVSARRDLDIDESPILTMLGRVGGRVLLGAVRLPMWVIRLGFDRSGTWAGVREWVLDEAPLAPGRTRASLRAVAAVEQAGSVERAAEQARAEARAEVERIQALASGQVDETMQQAEELVSGARAEAAEQVRAAEQHAAQQIEQVRQSTEAKLQQADQTSEQLADELDRLRAEYDRVIGAASSKTRLIAAYERLGSAGDPRWMDRDRAGEVARELYQAAGLSSEGTARAYLYEYISGTKQGVSA